MWIRIALAAVVLAGSCEPAWAHTAERGFVMLLPTGYYIAGGAAAVAGTFAILLFVPGTAIQRVFGNPRIAESETEGVAEDAEPARIAVSCASFAVFILLVYAGFDGTRDPLLNPLPLAVWTLLWLILPLAQALLGNLWSWINPWAGPVYLLRRLTGGVSAAPPIRLPERIGYWPGIVALFAFGWFELVDLAPDDPMRLAVVACFYWLITFAAMLLFGERVWARRGECFSIFFGFIGMLAPIRPRAEGGVAFCVPGAKLLAAPPPGFSAAAFILLALATVSFDGLSRTFWYLDLIGINPLDFPGRSAVMADNTIGLAAAALILSGVYALAIYLGERLVGGTIAMAAGGTFVLSLLPISLAYHFAHYLTQLLVNAQYALLALTDPLGNGADLLGMGEYHVTTSFMADYHAVQIIWNLQAGAIVVGHIWAVILAHGLAVRHHGGRRQGALSQIPLAALMVIYTMLGLWLLASPTGA